MLCGVIIGSSAKSITSENVNFNSSVVISKSNDTRFGLIMSAIREV